MSAFWSVWTNYSDDELVEHVDRCGDDLHKELSSRVDRLHKKINGLMSECGSTDDELRDALSEIDDLESEVQQSDDKLAKLKAECRLLGESDAPAESIKVLLLKLGGAQ